MLVCKLIKQKQFVSAMIANCVVQVSYYGALEFNIAVLYC